MQVENLSDSNPSLKRGNIYCPEKDASENLRTRIKLISLWVGLIVIIVIGLLSDRVRGLTFRGQFKVTALPTESDPPQAERFSPTSLSGLSHE